jgi:hypothetical protein
MDIVKTSILVVAGGRWLYSRFESASVEVFIHFVVLRLGGLSTLQSLYKLVCIVRENKKRLFPPSRMEIERSSCCEYGIE